MLTIKTIGQVLKEKRTSLGLDLSEAEQLTQVQKLYWRQMTIKPYRVTFTLKLTSNIMQKNWG